MPEPTTPDADALFRRTVEANARLIQGDTIGYAAMHETPAGLVAAIDLGDAERPVLFGQVADAGSLPLDLREHDHVGGGVGLHEFGAAGAAAEKLGHRREPFGPIVEAAGRWAAERRHEDEVGAVRNTRHADPLAPGITVAQAAALPRG